MDPIRETLKFNTEGDMKLFGELVDFVASQERVKAPVNSTFRMVSYILDEVKSNCNFNSRKQVISTHCQLLLLLLQNIKAKMFSEFSNIQNAFDDDIFSEFFYRSVYRPPGAHVSNLRPAGQMQPFTSFYLVCKNMKDKISMQPHLW